MIGDDDKLRVIEAKHKLGEISDTDAERQQKLNEACRYALKDFVGREMTPTLLAEAEGRLHEAFMEMILAGVYVLPRNMQLDRIELGDDMRIKVYFKRTVPV